MDMSLNISLAEGYKSHSQIARVVTEDWVVRNMFCPRCGHMALRQFENNRPAADFFCEECGSQFELKSKSGSMGRMIPDGAYDTMIERITGCSNPDFMLMSYSPVASCVTDLLFVPGHFITPSVIEKRKPLGENSRRAGWMGCNILFDKIPRQGRIAVITGGIAESVGNVLCLVRTASKLDSASLESRSWLFDVLNCVNAIAKDEFSLNEVYQYEELLQSLHPDNHHIQAKIRQQLQFLRNAGFLEFSGRGQYRKADCNGRIYG